MKMVTAVAGFCIIVVLCLTSLLGINNNNGNTDKIVDAIDNNKIEQPVVVVNNNVETNDNELKAISDKLNSMEEKMNEVNEKARETEPKVIIVEKEVEVPVETNTVSSSNKTYLDRPFETGTIVCEICNKGGEVETWYDTNQEKHITHTYRCTGALDSFYGPSVRAIK